MNVVQTQRAALGGAAGPVKPPPLLLMSLETGFSEAPRSERAGFKASVEIEARGQEKKHGVVVGVEPQHQVSQTQSGGFKKPRIITHNSEGPDGGCDRHKVRALAAVQRQRRSSAPRRPSGCLETSSRQQLRCEQPLPVAVAGPRNAIQSASSGDTIQSAACHLPQQRAI